MSLVNVTVGRYDADPEALGVVKAEDGAWQVVVDKHGCPHLWVRAKYEADDGTVQNGLIAVDDFLADGFDSVRDLMEGTFGGKCTPEEEQEAQKAWNARKKQHALPCPR